MIDDGWHTFKTQLTQCETPTALHWTTTKPRQPGWYWWRLNEDDAEVTFVEEDGGVLFIREGDGWRQVGDIRGEFAGPIEPPEEEEG